ncbi:MAG: hypothetical protein P1V51_24210, partial [Deltaproteobacteria bacterium]|nr:hypothetical protein [Deltaproteobacteria bacterium]
SDAPLSCEASAAPPRPPIEASETWCGELAPELPDPRLALLAALVEQAEASAPGEAPFRTLARRGLPALHLLEGAWQQPAAFLGLQGRPLSEAASAALRSELDSALEEAVGDHLRQEALARLDRLEGQLRGLVEELQGGGPRPRLAALFAHLEALPFEARASLLRGLGLSDPRPWLNADAAPHLFEAHHRGMLEDPEAARARLLEAGEAEFMRHTFTFEGMAETLSGRLEALEDARAFVEGCESPLLTFRPLARELAAELPGLARLHEAQRATQGGVRIEVPREGWKTDLTHAFLGSDERLAETLLLAGLADEAQADLAGHRAGFEATAFLASFLAPSPLSGVTSGAKRAAAAPVAGLAARLEDPRVAGALLRLGVPVAEKAASKLVGKTTGAAIPSAVDLVGALIQGDGRYDAPLVDPIRTPPARR